MNLSLKISVPGEQDLVVLLDQPRMLMGSLASNQVVFKGSGVEPIHALIEEFGNNWTIFDLGSDSGVRLNGKQVDVESTIQLGDKLELGEVSLVIQMESGDSIDPATNRQTFVPPPPVSNHSELSLSESDQPNLSEDSGLDMNAAHTSTSDQNDPNALSLDLNIPQSNSAPQALGSAFHIDPVGLDEEEITQAKSKPVEIAEEAIESKNPQPEEVQNTSSSPDSGRSHPVNTGSDLVDERLFAPKKAKPRGSVLEVVSYWGDTILSLEHFHGSSKEYEQLGTIGNDKRCHFAHAGPGVVQMEKLVEARSDSYRLFLTKGMTARIRRKGKVHQLKDKNKVKMGPKDLAQIKCGPISYFVMYTSTPRIKLDKSKSDPLFAILSGVVLAIFLGLASMVMAMGPLKDKADEKQDDIEIAFPVRKFEQVVKKMEKRKIKPVVKLQPPPKVKPKPKPKPKPIVVKPQKVTKPKPVVRKPPKVVKPQKVVKQSVRKPTPKPKKPNIQKLGLNNSGTFSTKSTKPDFKLAGRVVKNKAKGRSGGNIGGGMNKAGAARKGKDAANNMGTQDGKSSKSSGRNLAKLGLGQKVSNKSGGVHTNFKSGKGGGMGKSMGTGARTLGFGGTGSIASTGIAGSKNGVNSFGTGSGGYGSGSGGTGGLGKGVGGRGVGGSRAAVVIATQDGALDVGGGGLTSAEINKVIHANIGKFRACYSDLIQVKPGMSGGCLVSFTIGLNGRATKSAPKNCIQDGKFKNCMASRMKQLQFPKPRGGSAVSVNYPFNFQKR